MIKERNSAADFCYESRDPGTCSDFETRYGYDPGTNTCVPYQYGGCGGTLNNFRDLAKCTEICCNEFAKVWTLFSVL